MIKYFLFDLDGTLTDPREGITRSVQFGLEHFGICENREEVLLKFIGPPLIDSFQNVTGLSYDDSVAAVAKYRERFSVVGLFENSLIPGVSEMLSQLSKTDKTICLATSKPDVFTLRILNHFGISGYFDFVGAATLDGRIGKKAEVIRTVLAHYPDAEASEFIMIGDRKEDILGAKECSLASVGVRFGYAEEGELEKAGADYIVGSVEELEDLLKSL